MRRNVRWWTFRIATAIAVPAVMLLAAEGVLRLVGYGHPGEFTVPCTVQGKSAFCENDRFTWQFFPPGMFRLPYSFAIPAGRTPRTYRIIVIGESAAQGVPEPSYGFSRYLDAMLRDRFPAVAFEVINTSVSSINSHVLLPMARSLAYRDADLFVLYIGNNEVVGPFGPETTLTPRASSLALIRAGIFLRSTRLGQLLAGVLQSASGASQPGEWRGIRMFLEQRVPADAPAMAPVYANFRRNLRDILQVLRASGTPVLISTVGANLRDCAPFGSLHRADLSPAERDQWEALVRAGAELEAAGQYTAAKERYLSALAIDDQYAELQFRLARSLWALGEFESARSRFVLARDLDVLRFRADGRMNQIIRSVATAAGRGVELLDGEALFAAASPHGVPGREMFYEHVHLSPEGNYRLAGALFPRVAARLPGELTRGSIAPPTRDETERLLALTGFDHRRIAQLVGLWLSQPPFTYQLNHEEQIRELQAAATAPDGNPDEIEAAYRWAISRAPTDHWLRFNYGVFLERSQPAAALAQFRAALDLLPNNHLAREKLVDALLELEQFDAALAESRELLRRMPYHGPIHLSMGYALARLGRLEESIAAYKLAIERQPELAVDGYNQIGIIQLHQKRFASAAATFQKAIELDTGHVRAPELQQNLGYARAALVENGGLGSSASQ
jgi:tetratricopeptide (TPR) repeat protein